MNPSHPAAVNSPRNVHYVRVALAALALLLIASTTWAATPYGQTNLVSSVSGVAPVIDTHLKNPWGIALSDSSPFWIANEVTGTATVYNGNGQPFPIADPRIVTIPAIAGGLDRPTGTVFNPTNDFDLDLADHSAMFIFATRGGSITGWNPLVNPDATVIKVSTAGADYTGLALGNNGSGNFLYAANSAGAKIEVFDANYAPASLSGSFTDPNLPAGFTPYNIQNLAGTLFVTYENETSGGGIIDVFDLNGNLMRRFSNNAAGGPLDSPWGLAVAPATFGSFGGALLVGNEGNGHINAFNPITGQFLGELRDSDGNPIANPGLWGLTFGNGGNGGDQNFLYFTAGIQDEREGLFGFIRPVPEPSSMLLFVAGALAMVAILRRQRCAST